MLSVIMLNVFHAESRLSWVSLCWIINTECCYVECRSCWTLYTECCFTRVNAECCLY